MISVCMATYNGGPYIADQLSSIIQQLDPQHDEVVISDDGSTDDTLSAIRHLQAQSPVTIRLVSNTGEHGYTPNFQNALQHAQGEWIFLSDQDDVWLPGKVARMLAALQSLPPHKPRLAVSNATITDGDLHPIHPNYFAARGVHRGFWGNVFKFGYLGCCLAFHRSLLDCALPFPANRRYCTHDNWLYLCAQAMGHVQVIHEPLMLYRRHTLTSTTGALNAHKPLAFRIAYRLYLLWHIACRRIRTR